VTSKPEDLLIHTSSTALAPARLERLRQRPDGMPTEFLTSLSIGEGRGEASGCPHRERRTPGDFLFSDAAKELRVVGNTHDQEFPKDP